MNKNELRKEYGYNKSDFILLYIAEFIERKNHEFLLNAIPKLKKQIPNLKVILPGKGVLLEKMKTLAENLEINEIVNFPGYRKDVNNFCRISDIHVAVSHQEGQGINNIEAMACGLPLVVSNIRGHKDVCENGFNGLLFSPNSQKELIDAIILLYKNPCLRDEMGKRNVQEAKKYSVDIAVEKMEEIYKKTKILREGGGKIIVHYEKTAPSLRRSA